jgi:transposase
MRPPAQPDPKSVILRRYATLNPHPELVKDALFQTHAFFDARDLVQVKYEMVRRVLVEGQTVTATAAAFGVSRVTLYQLRRQFEAEGLAGLLPRRRGPRRAHKLSDELVSWIMQTLVSEPELRIAALPQRIGEQFGIAVHVRSVERALARQRKKFWPAASQRSGPSMWVSASTRFCASRCLRAVT